MAANDDPGIEIRRQNKTKPTIVAVVIAAVVAVLLVRDPGASFDDDPVTTTQPISQQTTTSAPALTTTAPPTSRPPALVDFVPLRALAVREDEVFALSTLPESVRSQPVAGLDLDTARSVTHAVATEDLLVVRTGDGEVLVAGADARFRTVGCCWSGLTPSNEPRHVWALTSGAGAELVDLRNRIVVTELEFDTRVAGPATFGLVTRDFDATASWHRPGFDATVVPAPDRGRRPRTAGGEIVVFAATDVVEARRLTDGALVRAFDAPGAVDDRVGVVLSPMGDALAIVQEGRAQVFDVVSGELLGTLEEALDVVVSIGQRRFATVIDGAIVDSTGRSFGAFVADPLIIATRAE